MGIYSCSLASHFQFFVPSTLLYTSPSSVSFSFTSKAFESSDGSFLNALATFKQSLHVIMWKHISVGTSGSFLTARATSNISTLVSPYYQRALNSLPSSPMASHKHYNQLDLGRQRAVTNTGSYSADLDPTSVEFQGFRTFIGHRCAPCDWAQMENR